MHQVTLVVFLALCGFHFGGCGDCPGGWTYYAENCYLLLHDTMSWYEAKTACDVIHSRLAEIDDADQNNFISTLLTDHHVGFAWIGLHDLQVEGKFVWASNGHAATYQNFYVGQPSDVGVWNEDCVAMYITGAWYDDHCHSSVHPAVCQIAATSYGGSGDGVVG